MTCRTINTERGVVELRISGKGIPVLFIHGGHSNCQERLVHKGLDKNQYQLITPSRPGYGRTPLSGHESPEAAAALLSALLDALDIDQGIVYGISAGGLTALAMAANYPGKVKKLILASAITKKWLDADSSTYKTAKRIFHPRMEGFTWSMVRLFASWAPRMMARNFIEEFSSLDHPEVTREEAAELAAALRKYRSGKGFINDIDQTLEVATLRRITCPTLILHSKYDKSVPPDHARHGAMEIENAMLHLLDNKWGHMIWIGEDYEQSEKIITGFIK